MMDENVRVEPFEEIFDSKIGLLFTYRMSAFFSQAADVPYICLQPRQIVFGDVPTNPNVVIARYAQVCDNIDRMKVHALANEITLDPSSKCLNPRAQIGSFGREVR